MSTRSREMLEFNVMDHVEEIAAPFSGMNQEYEKMIREYHKVYLDNPRRGKAAGGWKSGGAGITTL